jgi:hypothetical protein
LDQVVALTLARAGSRPGRQQMQARKDDMMAE